MSDKTDCARGGQRGDGSSTSFEPTELGLEVEFPSLIAEVEEETGVEATSEGAGVDFALALLPRFRGAGGMRGLKAGSGSPSGPSTWVGIESYATIVVFRFVLRFVAGAAVSSS